MIGLAVDPDVDRLALVDETGHPIGEDYTLAFAVRSVLDGSAEPPRPPSLRAARSRRQPFHQSCRRGCRPECGARFVRAAVGEANVARAIRDEGAVIGGEGNGGVILPALHIGRDAPVGVALILHLLARSGQAVSRLVAGQPQYRIVKAKGQRGKDLAPVYAKLTARFSDAAADTRDGLRLAWKDRWVHIRPSGTEPIVRFIAEAPTAEASRTTGVGLPRTHGIARLLRMCGIVGYVGPRQAAGLLLEGLRRLEYRGYDSSGIAVVNGAGLTVMKQAGKLSALEKQLEGAMPKGSLGIGHTRWATHGAPTTPNAHPHTDQTGRIALIHNGIIENSGAIRRALEQRGHTFKSETDTEVLAHLVGRVLQRQHRRSA